MSARQPVGRPGHGARRAVAMTVIVGAAVWAVLVTETAASVVIEMGRR